MIYRRRHRPACRTGPTPVALGARAVAVERADSAGTSNSHRGTGSGRQVDADTSTICNFVGGGEAHNNLQPYIVLLPCIKT
jgi:microcystin-dependent protein